MHPRPWTAIYHAQTAPDLPPRPHPHLPALIRESAARFRSREACALGLPNGVQGGLRFEEVDALSDAFAVYLREVAGFSSGDRLAIQMPNCLAYPVVVFGALKAGVVMVNTNPLYTVPEMTKQFVDSGATGLVTIDLFADRVADVLPATGIRRVVVVTLSDLLPTARRWLVWGVQKYVRRMIPPVTFPHDTFTQALAEGRQRMAAGADATAYARALTHDSLAALQYTGGTTGVAKGAMLTHGNLLANIEQCLQVWRPWLLPAGDAILTALPLYHIFGLTACCLLMIRSGGCSLLIANPRDVNGFVRTLRKSRFTLFSGVNTLYAALVEHPDIGRVDFSKLVLSVSGGMSTQQPIAQRWKALTGKPIVEGYGLSETSPILTVNRPDIDEFTGAIGYPLPSTELTLRTPEGDLAPPGARGEILARGPQVMPGYWMRADETAKVMTPDGYFRTGDIAVMSPDGLFTIVDRVKDIIIVSGFNVYPNEVEAALAGHPGVKEVAVVGAPFAHSGEAPVAFIVPRDPNLTPSMLRAFAHERLTGYKTPRRYLFRESLPKTNVGKILRRTLKEEALTLLSSGSGDNGATED